ncbi:MAG: two-component system, cell cycle response regulator [Pseudomonadota bacterium]|nr:two-component system, cell cycle response regulator [Pseudomonadota bacterium]
MDLELKKFEQIKATGELPSPKGVALSIIRLTQRDDVSALELEHAIKTDPAFVGRLLKAANAAGRANGRPIVAIADALNVLGMAVVRNLALSFSLVSGYRKGNCPNFDFDQFWNRSLLTGLTFQEINRHSGAVNPEEAFCCGLLADVGRLALATLYPQAYSQLLEELGGDADPALLHEREEALFALANDDLTAAMLTDWGLPKQLIESLYYRLQPERSRFAVGSRGEKLVAGAILAAQVADVCQLEGDARGERLAKLGELAESSTALALTQEALGRVVDAVAAQWRDWGETLQLKVKVPPSFSQMMTAAVVQATGTEGGTGLRVLVALGDKGERQQVAALLHGLGYNTAEAQDGEMALEAALDMQPQILVADAAMTGIDGIRLIRALRETKLGRVMYMLLLTSAGDEDRLVEAYEAGADDYLVKPLKERVLAARLRAGARVAELQVEVERDQREMKHFAAELAVSNRRLHEASVTDPLTGFYNRRYALERLEQEWAASNRSKKPLSCLVIDFDRFKEINDGYGHDVGDKVLAEVAGVLQQNLRTNDVICRMGGDEFLVISPDTDSESMRACALRLLAAVEQSVIDTPRGPVRCGVSIGVATRDAGTATLAMLMKAADEGMYQAKISGRRRIGERFD